MLNMFSLLASGSSIQEATDEREEFDMDGRDHGRRWSAKFSLNAVPTRRLVFDVNELLHRHPVELLAQRTFRRGRNPQSFSLRLA
jgi:hypothetical protein